MTENKKEQHKAGYVDRALMRKLRKDVYFVRCPNGHANTTTAKVCWKCGSPIEKAAQPCHVQGS